jgi:hypothetical protein
MAIEDHYDDFIPVNVSREMMETIGDTSAVLEMARKIPMPTGLASIPVVSVAPEASFTNPRIGGRKEQTAVDWTLQNIVPEELAATLAIPNAFIDDAGFPVWASVRSELTKAFAKAFDAAALFGTGAPASFPAGGLVAPAWSEQPASGADALAGIDAAFAEVEANGLEVGGIVTGPGIRSVMRGMGVGYEVAAEAPMSLYGVPFRVSLAWNPGTAAPFELALLGDWDYVVVGLREDIRFELSTDGVLTDGAGAVTISAFESDTTLLRCYMRVGLVVGLPLGYDGTAVKPLAVARAGTMAGRSGEAKTQKKAAA